MENIQVHDYRPLFTSTSGSHAYGFSSVNSDHDIRGVHILPVTRIISLDANYTDETIVKSFNKSDGTIVDFVSQDVRKFFSLILKKDGNSLEQLFSPLVLQDAGELMELREIVKEDCITKHNVHHYLGFGASQWNAFVAGEYRLKNLLYTYRVLLTGLNLMNTGSIQMHLPTLAEEYSLDFIPRLIEQKKEGEDICLSLKESLDNHEINYLSLLEKLRIAAEITHLKEHCSSNRLNDFLIRVRLKYGN